MVGPWVSHYSDVILTFFLGFPNVGPSGKAGTATGRNVEKFFLGIWECQSYHGNDRSSYSGSASWFGWFFLEHFMAKHSLADNRDAKQCNKRINKTQFVGAPNRWSAFPPPPKLGMTFGTPCLLLGHPNLYKFGTMVRWLRHNSTWQSCSWGVPANRSPLDIHMFIVFLECFGENHLMMLRWVVKIGFMWILVSQGFLLKVLFLDDLNNMFNMFIPSWFDANTIFPSSSRRWLNH